MFHNHFESMPEQIIDLFERKYSSIHELLSKNRFIQNRPRTELGRHTIRFRRSSLWSAIPPDMKDLRKLLKKLKFCSMKLNVVQFDKDSWPQYSQIHVLSIFTVVQHRLHTFFVFVKMLRYAFVDRLNFIYGKSTPAPLADSNQTCLNNYFMYVSMYVCIQTSIIASHKYFTIISKVAAKIHHVLIWPTFIFLQIVS